jgi:hypothetical protein
MTLLTLNNVEAEYQFFTRVKKMNRRMVVAALVMFLGSASGAVGAEDPTGTWKFTAMIGKKSLDATLNLKREGNKLTGTIGGGQGNREAAITDGTFENDKVSFSVVREQKGEKLTQKYTGTISGDTIKGTITTDRGGKSRSTDWEAKRQK